MFRYYFCLLVFLVLTRQVMIKADDDPFAPKKNENDDPFAPTNDNEDEDPFASDPFASSEPNPWEKYPWDVTESISHATGALSLVGSAWIISEILLDKKKRSRPYHRIMFGLSTYDFASSFWLFIGVWVNKNSRGFTDTAHASSGWCETSGFTIYLGSICIPMYNAALAIYFWTAVKQGWKEERIVRSYERYVHVVIFICGIIPSIAALILNLYNPWYNYCFATYIEGRGTAKQANIFLGLFWAIVFASALVVTATMACIYISVYKLHKKVQRFSFARRCERNESVNSIRIDTSSTKLNEEQSSSYSTGSFSFNFALKRSSSALFQTRNDDIHYTNGRKKRTARRLDSHELSVRRRQNRTSRVRTIALLYTIPFYATWVVPCIFFSMTNVAWNTGRVDWITPRSAFVMNTYIATALPLQGFINWFIYMLPRFQRLRQEHPSWSMKKILIGVVGRMFSRKPSESISKRGNQQQQQEKKRNGGDAVRIGYEAEKKDAINTPSKNSLQQTYCENNEYDNKNNNDEDGGENRDSTCKIYDHHDDDDDESMMASMFYGDVSFDIEAGESQFDQIDANTRETIQFNNESSTATQSRCSSIQENSCTKDINVTICSQLEVIDAEIQHTATAAIGNLDLIQNGLSTGEFSIGEQTLQA